MLFKLVYNLKAALQVGYSNYSEQNLQTFELHQLVELVESKAIPLVPVNVAVVQAFQKANVELGASQEDRVGGEVVDCRGDRVALWVKQRATCRMGMDLKGEDSNFSVKRFKKNYRR